MAGSSEAGLTHQPVRLSGWDAILENQNSNNSDSDAWHTNVTMDNGKVIVETGGLQSLDPLQSLEDEMAAEDWSVPNVLSMFTERLRQEMENLLLEMFQDYRMELMRQFSMPVLDYPESNIPAKLRAQLDLLVWDALKRFCTDLRKQPGQEASCMYRSMLIDPGHHARMKLASMSTQTDLVACKSTETESAPTDFEGVFTATGEKVTAPLGHGHSASVLEVLGVEGVSKPSASAFFTEDKPAATPNLGTPAVTPNLEEQAVTLIQQEQAQSAPCLEVISEVVVSKPAVSAYLTDNKPFEEEKLATSILEEPAATLGHFRQEQSPLVLEGSSRVGVSKPAAPAADKAQEVKAETTNKTVSVVFDSSSDDEFEVKYETLCDPELDELFKPKPPPSEQSEKCQEEDFDSSYESDFEDYQEDFDSYNESDSEDSLCSIPELCVDVSSFKYLHKIASEDIS